ncbi:hypothetical protein J3D48_006226 [Pseudomonas fluorescens]|uniref:hypothetical protein n=1 Tax=Pseudomonas fluorescens TaxID=294 RepID=UPI00209F3631|nr:hypothetical protein [Pseudomonas fluorescens]MCP1489816.1 hypothetical protein [Pseudomonas fluorescens]
MPKFAAEHLARQESLSDEIENESEFIAQENHSRGPAYLNGASHGSTGLAPPRWKYEFERPGGHDFWHKESQPSPRIFNRSKHQHIWGSDRPITGSEMGKETANSTMPLDVLKRRKSFTRRPIAIVSGTHGAWHGNNWETAGGRATDYVEPSFLTEDMEARLGCSFVQNPSGPFEGYAGGKKVKGNLSGFILKRDSKSGVEYYVSDSAQKGSFESRIRIYDGGKLTESDVRGVIGNLGNHVILGYCFSRNEESLRYKGAAAPLAPVTSYQSEYEKLPFGPGRGVYAPEGTIITDRGKNIKVPVGAFIHDAGGRNCLQFSVGRRKTVTGPNPQLWLPPEYNPGDPQAPTEAVYKAHNP